jgi:hypothetical protein
MLAPATNTLVPLTASSCSPARTTVGTLRWLPDTAASARAARTWSAGRVST